LIVAKDIKMIRQIGINPGMIIPAAVGLGTHVVAVETQAVTGFSGIQARLCEARVSDFPQFLRPPSETCDHLGGRIEIIDPQGILRRADEVPVQVVQEAPLLSPVTDFTVTISTGSWQDRAVYNFLAVIELSSASRPETGVAEWEADLGAGVAVGAAATGAVWGAGAAAAFAGARVGASIGPIGIVLGAAAGGITYHLRRMLSTPDGPRMSDGTVSTAPQPVAVDISESDLKVAVSGSESDGRIVLQAAVRKVGADNSHVPPHLRAFTVFALDVVAELVRSRNPALGDDVLAGNRYVISHYPGGRWLDIGDGDTVRLSQVGGLEPIIEQLRYIINSYKYPEEVRQWGARRPQGIMFYGPPGTGKDDAGQGLGERDRCRPDRGRLDSDLRQVRRGVGAADQGHLCGRAGKEAPYHPVLRRVRHRHRPCRWK
jgi:transitional endoplasmic reticulum ATPase